MQTTKTNIDTAKILKEIEIGLKPVLENWDPKKLSSSDKAEILSELDKLEQLALKIKVDLIAS